VASSDPCGSHSKSMRLPDLSSKAAGRLDRSPRNGCFLRSTGSRHSSSGGPAAVEFALRGARSEAGGRPRALVPRSQRTGRARQGANLTRARRVPDSLLLLTLRASHFSGRAACFLKIRSPVAPGRSWVPTADVPGTTATWCAVQYISLILVGTATRQCVGRLPSVDVPLVDSRARVLL
jgi:hypothetical protein